MTRALVLGAGGVAGIAWETGLLLGLRDAGVDLTAADVVVGTSAGSAVGAQVASGEPVEDRFALLTDAGRETTELAVEFDAEAMMNELLPLLTQTEPGAQRRAAVGAYALRARTVAEDVRRTAVAARLPSTAWPSRPLRIVAVDAESGDPRVFDGSDGVSLVDAVTASCAVPGVWPAVTIGDRRYIDGGLRSSTNLDLAAGCDGVVVLAPMGEMGPLDSEVQRGQDAVRALARVVEIGPDEATLAAFGTNPLDPSAQRPAALAGRAQAAAVVDQVRAAWSG